MIRNGLRGMIMAEEARDLLTVTKAAKRLGVHPNTLRTWADQGLIATIRLPSGHRRFEWTEVEKKRRDMGFKEP
jgi:excisionase family DNA binding protein